MASPTDTVVRNRLIAALPRNERQRLLARCESVELVYGEVLAEAGERCTHVYFPTGGFISLVMALDDGARLEVGIIGDEGLLGTSLILGVKFSPLHAVVQGAGPALRITATDFRRELERSAALRNALDRYIYVLMNQLAQTAICTHFHVVEARLARWLLISRDRARASQFHLTHQFLAYMLGVRRVGVTEAAGSLEHRGLIEYHRGEIRILNEPGLEEASCQCYAQGKRMYEDILGASSLPPRL